MLALMKSSLEQQGALVEALLPLKQRVAFTEAAGRSGKEVSSIAAGGTVTNSSPGQQLDLAEMSSSPEQQVAPAEKCLLEH